MHALRCLISGGKGKHIGRYRITDSDSLEAAMEAGGRIRLTLEAKLSPGPPILNLRRHGANSRWHELGANVASGNFLAAKVSLACLVHNDLWLLVLCFIILVGNMIHLIIILFQ